MTKCYTCGHSGKYLFIYQSTMAQTCREIRCSVCASELRKSDHKIIEEERLKNIE